MFYAILFVLVTSLVCIYAMDAVKRHADGKPQRKMNGFFSVLVLVTSLVIVLSGCSIEPVHTVYDTDVSVTVEDSKATVHIANRSGIFGDEYIELHTVQVSDRAMQAGPNHAANYIGGVMNDRTTTLNDAPIRFHGSAYRAITQDIMYR